MSKRPPINFDELTAMTSGEAKPMAEATQRSPLLDKPKNVVTSKEERPSVIQVDYSASLNFKVTPAFRERYRLSAAKADLKLNELLYEALEAWETRQRQN